MKLKKSLSSPRLVIATITVGSSSLSAGIIAINDVQTYQGDGTVIYNPAGTTTSGGVTSFGNVPLGGDEIVRDLQNGTFSFTGRSSQLSRESGLFNGSDNISITTDFVISGGSADIFSPANNSLQFNLRGLAGVTEIRLNVAYSEPIAGSFVRGNPQPGNTNPLGLAFNELTTGVGNNSLGAVARFDYTDVQHTTGFLNGDPTFSPGISSLTPDFLLMNTAEIAGFNQLTPTSFEVRGGGGYQGVHGWDNGDDIVNQPTDFDSVIDEGELNYITGMELVLTPGNGATTFTADTNFIMSFAGGQFNFVPEPSSAFLGLLGCTLMLSNRKRR